MKSIVLATLNARYIHSAFGLRYLQANLEELRGDSCILEFTIAQNPRDIVEAILKLNPRVVGFGVYIWNTTQTRDVVSILKKLRPEIQVVLGGPEVSHETELQEICSIADLTIQGEADFLFYEICRRYFLEGQWPSSKSISGELPDLKSITLPYSLYTQDDISNRVIYVEASRGCPYKCEYCLSSLDKSVRNFDLERFLAEMELLVERGARQFKFVDRTFNLSVQISSRILEFFLARIELGIFLHFEMVPDRLPPELRELIKKFPPGSLQFEVGIQTWDPQVARNVSRRMDFEKVRENFTFLKSQTGVHIHADLIVGLPGETKESFASGFDAVATLRPDEIQVGILKRLRGAPIARHDREGVMVYQDRPPYQVISTRTMDFETIQALGRFSHFWDLVANSGNFQETLKLLHGLEGDRACPSLFSEFERLSAFLSGRHPQGHGVALLNLVESLWVYLTEERGVDCQRVRQALHQDYCVRVKRDVPVFLRNPGERSTGKAPVSRRAFKESSTVATPRRQKRHLGAGQISQEPSQDPS